MLEYRVARFKIEQRELVIRVAPYGEVAELGSGYQERYVPGSLTPAANVALKLETGQNHEGVVIGRAVAWEERADGLYGTFAVSEIPDGDSALILARDGAVGASAGFLADIVKMAESVDADGVATAYGEIREVTLTGTPAYQLAGVAEVRSLAQRSEEESPMADTETNERELELESRADKAEKELDDLRREIATKDTPDPDADVTGTPRGAEYRSLGAVLVDMTRGYREDDAEARERLGALIEARVVQPTNTGVNLELRQFATPGVPGTDDLTPASYLPQMLELLKQGRAVANGLRAGNLDQFYGQSVQMPKVATASLVDYHTPAGAVASQNVVTELEDYRKAVLAGGQGISYEAASWSSPGYTETVLGDLASSFGEKVEFEAVNGVDAAGPPANVDGILAGATAIAAGSDDMAGLVAAIGAAWESVYTATRMQPIAILMSAKAWGWSIGQSDASGRPLVTQEAPQNPVGLGDASAVGTMRGLPVVVSTAIPTNVNVSETPVVVTNFRDAWLFESAGSPAQVQLTFPSSLVTDYTLFGAIATAIRRPDAFAAISGFTAT